ERAAGRYPRHGPKRLEAVRQCGTWESYWRRSRVISYYVREGGDDRGGMDHVLDTHSNLYTGERDFQEHIGEPTSLERDLLLLASAAFAADRASPRGEREDIARHV